MKRNEDGNESSVALDCQTLRQKRTGLDPLLGLLYPPIAMVVRYTVPTRWVAYDVRSLVNELTEAKAAVMSLTSVPYQRTWAEVLQQVQLKYEVAGTSRIEGADFTEKELDAALRDETPEEMLTRSQRQARAAVQTYRWIAQLSDDMPIDGELIREVHRRIVTGCDDDHCPPGVLRGDGQNVIFGVPPHRGADGGRQCSEAFSALSKALQGEFRGHDILIQALALHYHIGAMHPFLDGNGRTCRAVEALLLQRAGLRDTLFIALSNYYYEEKASYLAALSRVRANDHDLTAFLVFALRGITKQCRRLLAEIKYHVSKALFRDVMHDLFGRLRSTRKRVIAKRHITILNSLLDRGERDPWSLHEDVIESYKSLQNPWKAFVRDIIYLLNLKAIKTTEPEKNKLVVAVRLEWPEEITESDFFERIRQLPTAKTYKFMQRSAETKSAADTEPALLPLF